MAYHKYRILNIDKSVLAVTILVNLYYRVRPSFLQYIHTMGLNGLVIELEIIYFICLCGIALFSQLSDVCVGEELKLALCCCCTCRRGPGI